MSLLSENIQWLLGFPIFALFLSLVLTALQLRGVIAVVSSRLCMMGAWLVATLGVASFLNDAPLSHRVIAFLIVGIPLAGILISLEIVITRETNRRNAVLDLKAKLQRLSQDMLQFIADRKDIEPAQPYSIYRNGIGL